MPDLMLSGKSNWEKCMQKKFFTCLVFIIPVFVIGLSSGCFSTPAPELVEVVREVPVEVIKEVTVPVTVQVPSENLTALTPGLLTTIRGAENFAMNQLQFYISGKIVLERDDPGEKQELVGGAAVFEDSLIRRLITVEDQTGGLVLRTGNTGGGNQLYVCFDEDDNYLLGFNASGADTSQFQLMFDPQNDPLSDTRGTINYGGYVYKLRFVGSTPTLMVKVETRGTPEEFRRRAPGKRLNTQAFPAAARTTGSESLVPMTIDILTRLRRSANFAINQCQFFLSGNIVLERIEENRRLFLESGKIIFVDNHTTRIITIDEQTGGLAATIVDGTNDIVLLLGFDDDDSYQLRFSAERGAPNSRFVLQFNPQSDPFSNARGTVTYGDLTYRLRFNAGTPFLMMNFSQLEGIDTQQHTAPGRRIE